MRTEIKVNHITANAEERMLRNGWKIELPERCSESAESMYDRLSVSYVQVKIYFVTTQIRGLHKNIAMVKGRR